MTFTGFLVARLAEEDTSIRYVTEDTVNQRPPFEVDPDWAASVVAAMRVIMAEHDPYNGRCQTCSAVAPPLPGSAAVMMSWPCRTLRILAAVYSDHPDYDPAWKPTA